MRMVMLWTTLLSPASQEKQTRKSVTMTNLRLGTIRKDIGQIKKCYSDGK